MDYDKEIANLQNQIDILKEKQKEDKVKGLRCGDIYETSCLKLKVKIFNSCDSHDKWGIVYNDGSAMIFDSKYECFLYLEARKYKYIGPVSWFIPKD